jgi:hypothetical protein
MILKRFISLLLIAALAACPIVCRAGGCNDCGAEQVQPVTCPHCQMNQEAATPCNEGDPGDHSPTPLQPTHCELGNCLCAGAVTNGGSLDLQIDHVLGVFAACETLSQHILCRNLSPHDSEANADRDDGQSSGRRLRLRIESLLI